ncbi:hypothetical protein F8M41_012600 [Gigaspora margarita]|uniref:Uncharacterized protein n=1 Tax=Gigaspora margarita TaxID=4874 RepID=A0A8H3WXS6_GIGMA|nr:hypothetical protein F8M41_012600 [Gigaspora margarita]
MKLILKLKKKALEGNYKSAESENLKEAIVVIEAAFGIVSKIDSMMKGLMESLIGTDLVAAIQMLKVGQIFYLGDCYQTGIDVKKGDKNTGIMIDKSKDKKFNASSPITNCSME